jgi:phosphoglycerate dehydrogenase-like enzyme
VSDRRIVCLGYPALLGEPFFERVRAVDPSLEPVGLPVDPGNGDWIKINPGEPHEEPPAWATTVASERRAALAEAEVLIALHVPADVMSLAPGLRWVQGVGAGIEQFAAAGVPRDRVVVTNASGLSEGSMAEFVLGRLLQIWKRFREIEDHQRAHRYEQTYGRTFKGSTVGIVGMGHIGQQVAKRARALGARVVGNKRSAPSDEEVALADRFYTTVELHEMLGECDAVLVAAPATPETHHLIDTAALAAMRPGATLINVARGSLVDESALLESLESGHLGAAALDVFDAEPLPAESPLWDAPNLYASAHSSVSVDRYIDDVFDLFEENLRRYVEGKPLRNSVDMKALGFC